MLRLHSLRSERFHPTPTDNCVGPPREIVRLFGDDVELSNTIEDTDWLSDPVIPFVCEQCWEWGCSVRGIAHIVRTNNDLIWMPPYSSSAVWPPWHEISSCSITNTYLVSDQEWDWIRFDIEQLPAFSSFPALTNHDLIHLWLQQRPPFAVPSQYETFARHLQQHVIASHPLEIDAALESIASLEQELAGPLVVQHGRLMPISEVDGEFNSLFFDGDGLQEWVPFTATTPHRLVIAGEYVWVAE